MITNAQKMLRYKKSEPLIDISIFCFLVIIINYLFEAIRFSIPNRILIGLKRSIWTGYGYKTLETATHSC